MIGVRDFVPEITDEGGFFRQPEIEQLSAALQRANEWLSSNDIDVINIETVALPNIHLPGEQGPKDTQLRTSGEMSTNWYQFIRVWYRVS